MDKPAKAIAVAAGAVLRQGKILLMRRNFEPFIGCWGMPGGKIHLGEHIEEAVVREVREETGVRARFERFCGVLSEKVRFGGREAGAKSEFRSQKSEARNQNAEAIGGQRLAVGGEREADMHYLVLVSRLKGLTSKITESREGAVRWFQVKDLAGLKDAMIPSDWLMLERFGVLTESNPQITQITQIPGLDEATPTSRRKGTKNRIRHLATGPLDHWTTTQTYARCEIAKRRGEYRVVRFY